MIGDYIQVTFDDGSFMHLPMSEMSELRRAMESYASTGQDSYVELVSTESNNLGFYISKVQDWFSSTRESRRTSRARKQEMEAENREDIGWIED